MKSGRRFDLTFFLFGIFATLLGGAMLASMFLFAAFLCVGACHSPPGGVEKADVVLVAAAIVLPLYLFFALRWFWQASRSRL